MGAAYKMKAIHLFALCFGSWMACGMLFAQTGPASRTADPREADVWVVVNPRGDLELTIETTNLDSVHLDALRLAALPCDWRESQNHPQMIEGRCRRYFATDGGQSHGTLLLKPLVAGLRRQGARIVRLEWNDFGRPVTKGPSNWVHESTDQRTPFGPLKSNAYRYVSATDDELPEAFEIRIGRPWSPARLALPFLLTLFGPLLVALWLRWRVADTETGDSDAAWLYWMLTGVWIYWDSAVAVSDVAALAARLQVDSMLLTLLIGATVFTLPPLVAGASGAAVLTRSALPAGGSAWREVALRSLAHEAATLVPFGILAVSFGMFEQDWAASIAAIPIAYFTRRLLHGRVTCRSLGPAAQLAPSALGL
jgi:hypothetical protein